ncbi:MAG: CRTAC1 family protein [Gemmatimonadales bacterium]|nr:MAG: CRTAC1 family protein [Gemmatimonadales bacterium]
MSVLPRPCIAGLVLILVSACGESVPDPRPASTIEMAAELERLAGSLDPQTNPFANSARIALLESAPPRSRPEEQTLLEAQLADELLYAGRTREAIERYEEVLAEVRARPMVYGPELQTAVRESLGLAWLRLGEEDNCLLNHTSASCILPIQGDGLHELEEGSRAAIEHFSAVLERRPDALNIRWLLNIAHMTLGQHPHGVPEEWRIELPEEEPSGLRAFHDIAPALGLDVVGLSGGSVVEDFSGNGYLDVMVSSWGLRDPLRYFENQGDGRFVERTDEAWLRGITGGLNLVHADFDNDGHPDVLVLRGAWMGADGRHPNSLLRNNGDGTFTDITHEAGLGSRFPTQTAGWADFNGNGLLDLFIGNESQPGQGYRSELYRNNGDGTFTEIAAEVGLDVEAFVKGVAWGDYTNDGRPDLYLSIMDGPNRLFRNEGPDGDGWRFTEVGAEAGVQEPMASFPAWFFDFDNSGYLDLFVSGYRIDPGDVAREYLGMPIEGEYPRLYRNNGDGTFTDITAEVGLDRVLYTMGSNFGDLDNDGFLDLYVGTGDPDYRALMPNRMFQNVGGERFREVTVHGRFGNVQKGHGVSFADLNHNGHEDVHIVMGGALEGDTYQNLLFENPGTRNGWLTLRLRGVESNRMGVGVRVHARVATPDGPERSIHRVVGAGSSFGGNPHQVHLGLGPVDRVASLVIEWPASGIRQEFTELAANRILEIIEGDDELREVERPSFSYPLDHGHP